MTYMTYVTLYDIEAGVKVKFDMWKRFANHNSEEAVFLFQTLKTNDKGMLGFLMCQNIAAKITILHKPDTASCHILKFRTYLWFSSNQLWWPEPIVREI